MVFTCRKCNKLKTNKHMVVIERFVFGGLMCRDCVDKNVSKRLVK